MSQVTVRALLVDTVIDVRFSADHPLGDAVQTFIRREDAERSSRKCAATIPTSRATGGSRSESSRRAVEPPSFKSLQSAGTGQPDSRSRISSSSRRRSSGTEERRAGCSFSSKRLSTTGL
jgi:hypothetical protein